MVTPKWHGFEKFRFNFAWKLCGSVHAHFKIRLTNAFDFVCLLVIVCLIMRVIGLLVNGLRQKC